jgi:phosphatidylglycerophosphatase A
MSTSISATVLARVRSKDPLSFWLAVWFGCGLVPLAPGTAGTIGAIPIYLALRSHGPLPVIAAACLATAVGVWTADRVAKESGMKDPQIVVIDEVAGVLFTLAAAPTTTTGLVAGFVLFRLFDQFKPFPSRWCELHLPGGWGIVFDDVAAGAWGALVLMIGRYFGWI